MSLNHSFADLPSTKPYMVRAIWEWCNDNGFTPYLMVEVDRSCRVPLEFVKKGQIVLNISAEATQGLQIPNDIISFRARFGGVPRELIVPVARIAAIYARENGAGMAFEVEASKESATAATETQDLPPPSPDTPNPPPIGKRPHLQRVK
jgi:stringent starvation protein B